MLKGFTVDGNTYDLVYGVSRQINKRSTDLSGYMMDGSYNSDVIGTYVQYDVTMAVPSGNEAEYAALFLVLEDKNNHEFVMPFGQGTKTFSGRVTGLSDTFVKAQGNTQIWRAIKFTVTSNEAEDGSTL